MLLDKHQESCIVFEAIKFYLEIYSNRRLFSNNLEFALGIVFNLTINKIKIQLLKPIKHLFLKLKLFKIHDSEKTTFVLVVIIQ